MLENTPGVTQKHGRYYWVSKNKWHPLTRVDEGEVALLEAYYELTRNDPNTMAGILMCYLKQGVPLLGEDTQKKYREYILTRLIPYCGHMLRETMTAGHVAQYLEQRKEAGAPIVANRERSALSSACEFAMRKGWLSNNPCRGVRRNKEVPSQHYVEHGELVPALDRAPVQIYHFLGVLYLTGARQKDLMVLRKTALTPEGIRIVESKTRKSTGKVRTIKWSPVLRTLVSAACARSTTDFVFVNSDGEPWGVWALQSAMRRLGPDFTMRQLRSKAASDTEENILSHDPGMLRVYKRRSVVRPVK